MPETAATEYTEDQLRVSGPTTLDAVDAREFSAAGHTTVNGDVAAETVEIVGSTDVHGNLHATRVDASGSTAIDGEVVVESFDVSGTTRVDGSLSAVVIDASGAFDAADHVACEELAASGSTDLTTLAAEDVNATGATHADEMVVESFVASGAVDIADLEADTVDLTLGNADAAVTTLSADHVSVHRDETGWGLVGVLTGRSEGRLTVESLTADRVDLVDATVDELVAAHAVIGPGCDIGVLEAEDWEIDADATVEATKQIESE